MDSIFKRSYSTLEDAVAGVKQTGKENGYDLSIHKEKPSGRDFHTIVIRCAKGRPYLPSAKERVHETKRRKTSTHKTGCFPLQYQAAEQGRS
ncbi:uncharacterized protein TrAtP1_008646 [Trichoderma atroviride]|uniref:uncharacterized protein n=1 Tax=Hypocrea atroviridis TaxID=63577 RepID=UPI00331AE152|nr:hypothetical protein TrAtP1_008646 [Trichoderma atroviride]